APICKSATQARLAAGGPACVAPCPLRWRPAALPLQLSSSTLHAYASYRFVLWPASRSSTAGAATNSHTPRLVPALRTPLLAPRSRKRLLIPESGAVDAGGGVRGRQRSSWR
ncbi:unnamed protein product, partial [Urochloa humidicola]